MLIRIKLLKSICAILLALSVPHFLRAGGTAPTAQTLLNVDFGAGASTSEVGFAATGQTSNDFWNFYTRDDGSGGYRTFGALSNLKYADGTVSSVGLTIANAPGAWGNGSSDAMYNSYVYPLSGGNVTVTVTNLPIGQYDLYIYSPIGNFQVMVGGTDYGNKTNYDAPASNPLVWQEGRQYALYHNVQVGSGQAVTLIVRPTSYDVALISGLQIVTVSTTAPPSCVTAPSGLVSWWQAEGNANDSVDDNNGALQNGATFAAGKVGQAFSLDGIDDFVSIADSPSLRLANLTIEGWFNFAAVGGYRILVAKTAGAVYESYLLFAYDGDIVAGVGNTAGITTILRYNLNPVLGTWYHIAYTFDDAANYHALYIDGVLRASGANNTTIGYDTHPVTVGAEFENEAANYFFAGQIDEVTIYNRALALGEIQSIYNAGSAGKCVPPPPPTAQTLLNVDFGFGTSTSEVGFAATGQTANDFWNFYTRDDGSGGYRTFGALSNLKYADGTVSSVGLTIVNAPGAWQNGSSDAMYNSYLYPLSGGNVTVTVTNLPVGQYDLYIYSPIGNFQVMVGGTDYGNKTTYEVPASNPPVWQEGRQYALYHNVQVGSGQAVTLTVRPTAYEVALISGLQIATVSTTPAVGPFTNGSFELPVLAPGSSVNLAPGTGGLTGWTVGTTGVVSFANGPALGVNPVDGSQHIGFNGGNTPPGGSVSQTFSTTIGQTYAVSFYLGRIGPGAGTMSMQAEGTSSTGVVLGSLNAVAPASPGYGAMQTFSFTATTSASTLRFTDTSLATIAVDVLLDNVSVIQAPPPPTAQTLLNVDFGFGTSTSEVGFAATGQTANDFWNFYTRDDGSGGYRTFGALSNLKYADGTVSAVGLTIANAPGAWQNGSSDAMYNSYLYPLGGGNVTVMVTNLPVGQYDLYIYSPIGNFQVMVGGTDYGNKTTYEVPASNPPVWQEGRQYALYHNVQVGSGQAVTLTVRPTSYDVALISGLQIATASTTPGNHAPTANPQSVSVNEDTTAPITLTGSDVDGDALTFSVVGAPTHGTLAGTAPNLTYTPNANYFGPDSFTFKVNDGQVDSADATVTINVHSVNDAPVARATVSPLAQFPGLTNLVVISPNNTNAEVVLDGSLSSDAENDPLQYSWSEGTNVIATGVLATNVLDVGTHIITLTVSDGTDAGTATIEVEVITPAQSVAILISMVDQSNLPRKSQRPLNATLKVGAASFEDGNLQAGIHQLEAFQNKVRAQVAPLNQTLADSLINAAQEIIDALSGP